MTPETRPVATQGGAGGERVSPIEMLRLRLATAEAIWKEAKEQAGQAKRRQKLAKLLARRAKKHAKEAKANLAEVREALSQAESQTMASLRRLVRRKLAKAQSAKPGKRSGAVLSKKRSSRRRRIQRRSAALPVGEVLVSFPAPASAECIESKAERGATRAAASTPKITTAP